MSKLSVTIKGASCLRATPKAILVEAPALDEQTWVPKSVIAADSEVFDDDEGAGPGDLVVEEWWAEKRGWA